jgi:SOS-response transcriptional repressor LexA
MTNDQIILDFIKRFIDHNNYAPTFEEIRSGCGLSSKSLVNYWLDMLESNHLIYRPRNTARGIILTVGNTFPCLIREWPSGTFSVAMLYDDPSSSELIPIRPYLAEMVSEAQARATLEDAK